MGVEQYSLVAHDWLNLEFIINDLAQRVIGQELAPGSEPTFVGLTLTGIDDTQVLYSNANVLAGNSAFTFNDSTGVVTIAGVGGSGLTGYDLKVGDTSTPDYGLIQTGGAVFGRVPYNAMNMDLDGSVIIRNLIAPATSNIEFAFLESGGTSVRFALAKSAVGNASYCARSMLIAGPSVWDDDIVTVGYWQTNNNIFDNLTCDTAGDGADLGVQNDLEVEGDIFCDSIKESTSGSGITFSNKIINTTIELGHVSDTTLSRVSAGVVAIEGTNIAMSGGAFHDGFSDFVANEHIDHTSVTLTAGSGLTGGGDISTNRTFDLDINSLAPASILGDDLIPFWDTTPTATNKKISFTNLEGALVHDNLISGTIVDHDTGATGAELDTLTDNSMADALHRHSKLSASDGTPDADLALNATGEGGFGIVAATNIKLKVFKEFTGGSQNFGLSIDIEQTDAITSVAGLQSTATSKNSSGTTVQTLGYFGGGIHNGAGSIGTLGGVRGTATVITGSTPTITTVVGIDGRCVCTDGAITQAIGLWSPLISKTTGTITTAYGALIGSVTAGSTNYGIYTGAGLVRFGDKTSIESITPYFTLWNLTHEDSDGGRESRTDFKGEQSGGEIATLARIEVGHDGAVDDEKGYWDLFVNDGNDGDTPTKRIRVDSSGLAKFFFAVSVAGFHSAVTTKTNTDYTLTVNDDVVLFSTGATTRTATLPAASTVTGKIYHIKKIDAGAGLVTIDGNASETIDGDLTPDITAQYESFMIVSDGSNWHVV